MSREIDLGMPTSVQVRRLHGHDGQWCFACVAHGATVVARGRAAAPYPDAGLREGDADKLRTLATWFDHFDDWRDATGKIAPGIQDYREVQSDLRRIAAALSRQAEKETA